MLEVLMVVSCAMVKNRTVSAIIAISSMLPVLLFASMALVRDSISRESGACG
ncbi:MAG TPA: hypothetical protein VGQ76_22725 [Thermoanaerobaculia bacterium]|jgi:hypothetical protein|nr:hypothetical protein [Thermoanaerobaculia bacterium]